MSVGTRAISVLTVRLAGLAVTMIACMQDAHTHCSLYICTNKCQSICCVLPHLPLKCSIYTADDSCCCWIAADHIWGGWHIKSYIYTYPIDIPMDSLGVFSANTGTDVHLLAATAGWAKERWSMRSCCWMHTLFCIMYVAGTL